MVGWQPTSSTWAVRMSTAISSGAANWVPPNAPTLVSIHAFAATLLASVIRTSNSAPVKTVRTALSNVMMCSVSFHVRVWTTAWAACRASASLAPPIEPDTSMIIATFFGPEAAAAYHGRNRGSYPLQEQPSMSGYWA